MSKAVFRRFLGMALAILILQWTAVTHSIYSSHVPGRQTAYAQEMDGQIQQSASWNPLAKFWETILQLREWLKQLSERMQALLEAHEIVRADQDELTGYVASVNQNIAHLRTTLKEVQESYTTEEDFDQAISDLRSNLAEIEEDIAAISGRLTTLQTNQEEMDKTVGSISRSVVSLYGAIDEVREFYTTEEEFAERTQEVDEELSKLQNNLAEIEEDAETISGQLATLQSNQEGMDKIVGSISQGMVSLYDVIEEVKESYTTEEDFGKRTQALDDELSSLQSDLEVLTQRLDIRAESMDELTLLQAHMRRQIERIDQAIVTLEGYWHRIDAMDTRMHRLEALVGMQQRRIGTNRTAILLLVIGLALALSGQS